MIQLHWSQPPGLLFHKHILVLRYLIVHFHLEVFFSLSNIDKNPEHTHIYYIDTHIYIYIYIYKLFFFGFYLQKTRRDPWLKKQERLAPGGLGDSRKAPEATGAEREGAAARVLGVAGVIAGTTKPLKTKTVWYKTYEKTNQPGGFFGPFEPGPRIKVSVSFPSCCPTRLQQKDLSKTIKPPETCKNQLRNEHEISNPHSQPAWTPWNPKTNATKPSHTPASSLPSHRPKPKPNPN